jgi:hypothetical protein
MHRDLMFGRGLGCCGVWLRARGRVLPRVRDLDRTGLSPGLRHISAAAETVAVEFGSLATRYAALLVFYFVYRAFLTLQTGCCTVLQRLRGMLHLLHISPTKLHFLYWRATPKFLSTIYFIPCLKIFSMTHSLLISIVKCLA